MTTPTSTIAVVNSSGRQAASFIRVASAVGYHVRAQLRSLDGIVASEIAALPNVTVIVGDLYTKPPPISGSNGYGVNHALITTLFAGAQLAFINTTFWGDEVAIGKALADAAVSANITHYIYSSMPNHSLHNIAWPSLPLWSSKHAIETYIRGLPTLAPRSTFLYTGIYNNNFTSLPYPLFQMALQPDGSFTWTAPFHPDVPLPWLDAEHDVGAAVLQLIKDGVHTWGTQKIALAYEMLSPREACRKFERGVGRPVRYQSGGIEIKVKIPVGYRDQLGALEKLYAFGATDAAAQPPYFGSVGFGSFTLFLSFSISHPVPFPSPSLKESALTSPTENSCPTEALALWEGPRGLEEYAREVFPLEEAANGLTWMNEEEDDEAGQDEGDGEDEESVGAGEGPPARREESWLA
jgi:hypothetical protein